MKRRELVESLPLKHISVLLAEDHASFRRSLKVLIELDGDIEVVGEAKNGSEAVSLTRKIQPEVVVMDIAMPVLNGLQATQQIIAISPATKVLILSSHHDSEYIQQAMIFGASGYLLKQASTQDIAEAVREVVKGATYFSKSIPKQLRDECQKLSSKSELSRTRASVRVH
jgi:DNA-binding NarL/FixJ family response regulator